MVGTAPAADPETPPAVEPMKDPWLRAPPTPARLP